MVVSTKSNCIKSQVQLSALPTKQTKHHKQKKPTPPPKNTHTHNASLPRPSRNTTSWTCWCFPPSLLFQSHHDLERRARLSLLVWQICQNPPPMVAPPHSSLLNSAALKGRTEGCRFTPFWGVRK